MDRVARIRELVVELQTLAKEEWGTEYLDCDCAHECECDCYMCERGWQLTEMKEIHKWEEMLLPIVTSRNPSGIAPTELPARPLS